jgi:hypothetical protein
MLRLHQLRHQPDLVNDVDWDMTPEEAVTLYLEWGNNWSHGRMVRSRDDVSHYFVVNTWNDPPMIYLIRRSSQGAEELASEEVPQHLRERFLRSVGHNKGVYAVDGELRAWLNIRSNRRFPSIDEETGASTRYIPNP